MIPRNATHLVRGYAGAKHPNEAFGTLLLETWHVGEASMEMEVAAWKARRARGDVSKIEVTENLQGSPRIRVVP